jgi:hypothetical protein
LVLTAATSQSDRSGGTAGRREKDADKFKFSGELSLSLAFYRDDYPLTTDAAGQVSRSDFVRGPGGRVVWYRNKGRLYGVETETA